MKNKVEGLDTIRAVMAIVVMLGHVRFLNIADDILLQFPYLKFVNLLINNIFPGKIAVIVFFVLSGFCIHYPYAQGKILQIKSFYFGRVVRLGIPAIIALLIFKETQYVIWSVVCELVYYFLYPLILKVYKKYFWPLFIFSVCCAYGISIWYDQLHPYNGDFDQNGYYLDWIVGLPIWLLGTFLATIYTQSELNFRLPPLNINYLRISTWALAFLLSICRFQLHWGYTYTLPVFAIWVCFWMYFEIKNYESHKENPYLAYIGKISYSIYLIHGGIFGICMYFFQIPKLGYSFLATVLGIVFTMLASAVYYIIVESPSHKLSKNKNPLSF